MSTTPRNRVQHRSSVDEDLKVLLRVATCGTRASTQGPPGAEMRRYHVAPNARSPANSGCSLRDSRRSAFRPIETSKAAVCYVR